MSIIKQLIKNFGQSMAGNGIDPRKQNFDGTPKNTVGVQAQGPATPAVTNTVPSNQVKTSTKPVTSSSTANGTSGTAPMVGGKTFAQASAGITDRAQLGALAQQYQNAGNQGSTHTQPAPTTASTAPKSPVATSGTQSGVSSPYTVNNGLYGQLVTGLANQGNSQYQQAASGARDQLQKMSTDTSDIDMARKNLAKQIGINIGQQADIRSDAIPLEFQQGRGQVLQQAQQQKEAQLQGILGNLLTQRGQQQAGLTSAAGIAGNQQSQQQGAIGSAAGMAAPQFPSYTSAQFNPVTNSYGSVGGGQYGSGPTALSNIQSAQEAQTAFNNIQRDSPAIDNQFSAIANYAQQAGLTGSSPILTGFQARFGQNFLTNPAVIGFNQAVTSLNQLLQAQGEAPIDPNNATMQTVQQAQQTVRQNLARKQSSYQQYLGQTGNSSGSSGGSGGTMFGSFF